MDPEVPTTQNTEANAPASDSSPAESNAQPTASQPVTAKMETLADVAKAIVKANAPAEPQTAKTDSDFVADEAKATVEEEPTVVQDGETEGDEVADEKLPPFHEHPRWKEVIKERDALATKVEETKPLVERATQISDYCHQYGVSDQQLNEAIEIAALLVNDPLSARQRLKPIMDVLDGYSGDKLPDDLQQAVTDGTLDPKYAKELAQARNGRTVQQRKVGIAEQNASQSSISAVQTALNAWDLAHRKIDPDFQPKTKGAVDGKYELFRDKLMSMVSTRPVRSPQEAISFAEEALEAVNKTLERFTARRKPVSKVLPTNGSSSTATKPAPKTLLDVARQVIAKHRA